MSADDSLDDPRAVWRSGSYAVLGDWFSDASREVLSGTDAPLGLAGRDVLDVACGTGAVAIEAARRGARVTGLDLTPELLTTAEQRASAAGVDVTFVEGSYDDLGAVGAFDVIASSFGVMFADDPHAVATQLAGACRPGGTVAIAAWHRDGAFGGPPASLRALLPPARVDASRWAEAEHVAGFFAGTGLTVADARRASHPIPFASPEAAVEAFLTHSGSWMSMFDALTAKREPADIRAELAANLARRSDPTADGIALRAEYSVIHLGTSPHG